MFAQVVRVALRLARFVTVVSVSVAAAAAATVVVVVVVVVVHLQTFVDGFLVHDDTLRLFHAIH